MAILTLSHKRKVDPVFAWSESVAKKGKTVLDEDVSGVTVPAQLRSNFDILGSISILCFKNFDGKDFCTVCFPIYLCQP